MQSTQYCTGASPLFCPGIMRDAYVSLWQNSDTPTRHPENTACEHDGRIRKQPRTKRAHEFFDRQARKIAGGFTSRDTYTISDALRDHFKNREQRGDTSVARDRVVAKSMIEAHLGTKAVTKLTRRTLQEWINALVEAPPRVRTPKDATQKHLNVVAPDPDYQRRRRATVSRIWAILKAALNHAHPGRFRPARTRRRIRRGCGA
jgi:hypothetical protein